MMQSENGFSASSVGSEAARATNAPLFRKVAAAVQEKLRFDGARMFQNFCVFTPILWACGVLTICAVLMVLKMVSERWPRGVAINLIVISWLGIAFVQAATSILHSVAVDNFWGELHNLASFAVLGWVFGALIIAIGSAYRLATERTVRCVAILGLYMLVLVGLAMLLQLLGFSSIDFDTPLSMLLPSSPAVRFYTRVSIFMAEDTFGQSRARLILFFPYYTALGLGALSIVFISALDRNWKWRLTGMLGGSIATVLSWSRMAIFCLVLFGVVQSLLRLPRLIQIIVVGVCLGAGYVALLNGFDPIVEYDRFQNDLDAGRPGSNMARELIYAQSWAGFVESPYFGNGLNFPPAHKTEPIAIGSHSTTYGLLYTAGALGLAAFLIALLITFIAMVQRYLSVSPASKERQVILVGISMVLCIALYSRFEALYSLTVPCIVLFAWLGACFPSPSVVAQSATRFPPSSGSPSVPPERRRGLASVPTAAFERALTCFGSRRGL
jgi:hypothetical protein